MRSLRLRFFLITWPLVVVAVVGVALFFSRWTEIELEHMIATEVTSGRPASHQQMADTLSALMVRGSSLDSLSQLIAPFRLAMGLDDGVVILGPTGALIASTDPAIRVEDQDAAPQGAVPEGAAALVRSVEQNGMLAEEAFVLRGLPLFDPSGSLMARVYFIPTGEPNQSIRGQAPVIRANARRTLWIAVIFASLAAASAALLLARPIVGQISRLADVAARVRDGDLDIRLPVTSKDEIGELERSFNTMAASLEAAEVHKRNVVSDAAHELRTPLTNLVGTLEAIQDGLMTADDTTMASLRSEAELMVSLVDELQELSLAESGQLVYETETLDAVEEAAAAIRAYASQAQGRELQAPKVEGPIPVFADRRRLRQVLGNLLQNAIAHTDDVGRISIAVEERPDGVAFTVTDTGKGIPSEELSLIWERFHRVDSSRDRSNGGMGLGLAVVRQLVHGMDGHVSVGSEVGVGSMFTVVLPAGK